MILLCGLWDIFFYIFHVSQSKFSPAIENYLICKQTTTARPLRPAKIRQHQFIDEEAQGMHGTDLLLAARAARLDERLFISSSCANNAPPPSLLLLLSVVELLPPRLICCPVTVKDSNTARCDVISDSRSYYTYHRQTPASQCTRNSCHNNNNNNNTNISPPGENILGLYVVPTPTENFTKILPNFLSYPTHSKIDRQTDKPRRTDTLPAGDNHNVVVAVLQHTCALARTHGFCLIIPYFHISTEK